jgi:hypothetical protein
MYQNQRWLTNYLRRSFRSLGEICDSSRVSFSEDSKDTATDQGTCNSGASLDTLICSLLERCRDDATSYNYQETPRAEVAQLVEHSPEKAGVDSSILSLGTTPHFPFLD